MNKVNIPYFLDLLRKATCNYSIDNVKLIFSTDKYKVGMRGNGCIVLLNGDNDIITGIKENDTWELLFSNVSKNVKTYFDLIVPDEDGFADVTLKEEKLILKSGNQKSNLFFCADVSVDTFDGDGPKQTGEEVYNIQLDQSFIDTYSLIKKVGASFGKIYFSVKDNVLSMEATDKTSPYNNGMSITIGETDYEDLDIRFDFKTFNNIMTLINGDFEDFSFRIGYVPKSNGGMVSFEKDDGSERYYIISVRENVVQ
jgi:hypothetical protein